MGYPRIQPQREACLAEMAGRLLAEKRGAAREDGVEQKRSRLSLGFEGHAGPGGRPRERPACAHPHGDGQTLLREALLVADHNAYHLGQLVMLRRLLGIWKS